MLLPHLWADPTPASEPALAAVSGGCWPEQWDQQSSGVSGGSES